MTTQLINIKYSKGLFFVVMRIIGGARRGTKLYTLEGLNTRPSLDRVKEALFNIINFDLENAIILDLFSGSGALALESLSRGAKKAYLCDNNYKAIEIIKKNVQKTRFENEAVVINKSYEKALDYFKINNILFDIVFLDPPYESDYAIKSVEYIIKNDLLNDDGFIVIETDNDNVINNLNNVDIYDIRKYGRVKLLFLKKK